MGYGELMKRILIHEPLPAAGVGPDGAPVVVLIGVMSFVREVVFPSPYWRDGSADKIHAVIRLMKLFSDSTVDYVDVTDRDHEFLLEVALLKTQNLAPGAALAMLTAIAAIVDAKDVPEAA